MRIIQWLKHLFRKELSLNRVRDHVTIREGDETLSLYVDSDANVLIHGIRAVGLDLQSLQDEDSEEKKHEVAMRMARTIFGKEQSEKLLEFYHGNYDCVITICGMYFGDKKSGLGKKITRVQKKNR